MSKQKTKPNKPPQQEQKTGRPSKYGSIDLKQVEQLAGLGLTDIEIANVIGISERSLNNYKKNDEFMQSLKAGKDKVDVRVVQSLFKLAIEGNVTACIFWLKNRRKMDWRDKVEMEHSGSIEQRIMNMSEEERKQRLELLKSKLNANE